MTPPTTSPATRIVLAEPRRRPLPLAAALAGVLALLAWLLVPGTAAAATAPDEPAGDAVTWSVSTPNNEHGSDRPNFQYELAPGATLSDGIVVTNHAARELTVGVYAADAFINDAGQLDLLPAAQPSVDLGSWVRPGADSVTMAPGESVLVPFTVTVPAGATPGDYAAGVVTSLVSQSASGVSVDRRLGSRMYLRVTGEIVPGLTASVVGADYTGSPLPWQPGSVEVTYLLTNTGNVRLDPIADVRIAGPAGLGAVTVPAADLPELLPGDAITRTVTVPGVWPTVYTSVELTAGGTPTSGANPPVGATASTGVWTVPWVGLGLLVVAGALIVVLVRRRKRRARVTQERVDQAVQAALREAGVAPRPAAQEQRSAES